MDNRPVGVFDSGVGGLTALRELRALLPGESFVYFGDTARVPYGGREVSELRRLAASDGRFLTSLGVKAILVACGTISSNCLESVGAGVPTLGVVRASATEAARTTRNGRVGVLATMASARSGGFERALREVAPALELFVAGSPGLVPLCEAGRVSPGDPEVRETVRECVLPLAAEGIDTLILGCTHFPLLRDAIGDAAGEGVRLIDSGGAGAREMAALLRREGLLSDAAAGETRFYTSGDAETFSRLARCFLGETFDKGRDRVYNTAIL